MRVTRPLMLFCALALTAGGCAQAPVLRVHMVAAPAPPGIDNVVYGAAPAYAAPQPYYAAAAGYGAAAAPLYNTTATPTPGAGAATPNPATTRAAAAYATTIPPYDSAAPAYRAAAAPLYNAMPTAAVSAPAYPAPAAPLYNTMPTSAVGAPAYPAPAAPIYNTTAMPVAAAPVAYRPAAAPYPAAGYPTATYGYGAAPQWPYTLDTGDRLRIVVFGQDGLTNSYLVDAAGDIAMPLIGSVAVRGLTADQLSRRIGDLLRQGYVREPHVAVEIESYRPFFILGEVTQPGQYPYVANMTVETAVAIAGGFGPRGDRKTVIISRNYGGQVARFRTPVTAQVQPGDTIQVQERWF